MTTIKSVRAIVKRLFDREKNGTVQQEKAH
jgi:hypothetical protein